MGFLNYLVDETKTLSEQIADLVEQKQALSSGEADAAPVGEAVQACVVTHSSDSTNNKTANKKCNLSDLTITSDTNSVVIKPTDINSPLQIVSGYSKNKKVVDAVIGSPVGPCAKHHNKTFDVLSAKQKSDKEIKFDVESIPFYKVFDTGVLFPWNAETATYAVNANTCGQSIVRDIIVYPDVDITVEIPFDFSPTDDADDGSYSGISKIPDFTVSYSEDGKVWAINPDIIDKINEFTSFINLVTTSFNSLQDVFGESIKITPQYPAGNISLGFAWKEKSEPFCAGSEWHVSVNADPLLGATAEIQLDDVILAACTGPIAEIYEKVKDVLSKFGVDVAFTLTVSGSIGVDCSLAKALNDAAGVKSGGGVTGKVEADLKASASITIQIIFCASASAEADAGAKTGIIASGGLTGEATGVTLDLTLQFLGISFYFDYSVSSAFYSTSKDGDEDDIASSDNSNGNSVTVLAGSWNKTISFA